MKIENDKQIQAINKNYNRILMMLKSLFIQAHNKQTDVITQLSLLSK